MVSFCIRNLADVICIYVMIDVNWMLLHAALLDASPLSRGCQTVEEHPKPGHPTHPRHSQWFISIKWPSVCHAEQLWLPVFLAWTWKCYMKTIEFVVGCWLRIPDHISHFKRGMKLVSGLQQSWLYSHWHPHPVVMRGKHTDPLLTPRANQASYRVRAAALDTAALLLPVLRAHVGRGTPNYLGAFRGCLRTGDSHPQSIQRMNGSRLVHRAVTLLKTGEMEKKKSPSLMCGRRFLYRYEQD